MTPKAEHSAPPTIQYEDCSSRLDHLHLGLCFCIFHSSVWSLSKETPPCHRRRKRIPARLRVPRDGDHPATGVGNRAVGHHTSHRHRGTHEEEVGIQRKEPERLRRRAFLHRGRPRNECPTEGRLHVVHPRGWQGIHWRAQRCHHFRGLARICRNGWRDLRRAPVDYFRCAHPRGGPDLLRCATKFTR